MGRRKEEEGEEEGLTWVALNGVGGQDSFVPLLPWNGGGWGKGEEGSRVSLFTVWMPRMAAAAVLLALCCLPYRLMLLHRRQKQTERLGF